MSKALLQVNRARALLAPVEPVKRTTRVLQVELFFRMRTKTMGRSKAIRVPVETVAEGTFSFYHESDSCLAAAAEKGQ